MAIDDKIFSYAIDKDKLKEYRSKILDDYNRIDFSIAIVISQHYFGDVRFDFISEVLYGFSMSAYGRIQIFKGTFKDKKSNI